MAIWCHPVEVCKCAALGRATWVMDAGDPLDGRLGDQRLRLVMLALAEAHRACPLPACQGCGDFILFF